MLNTNRAVNIKLIYTVLIIGSLLFSACKAHKHGSGGRQQPKKGPIPCPLKDC